MSRRTLTAIVVLYTVAAVAPATAGALTFSGDAYINEMGFRAAPLPARLGGQSGENRR